jgi:hypothetical protein
MWYSCKSKSERCYFGYSYCCSSNWSDSCCCFWNHLGCHHLFLLSAI